MEEQIKAILNGAIAKIEMEIDREGIESPSVEEVAEGLRTADDDTLEGLAAFIVLAKRSNAVRDVMLAHLEARL